MNQSKIWNELHALFDTDDGSLPEIELTNLCSLHVGDIYLFLVSRGKDITSGGAHFWDNRLKQERAIDSVGNAATLVVQGIAEPFHIVISSLTVNGVNIPDLGIFVFQDSISLDYRMGIAWGPAELTAFLELLSQIKELAPDMQVSLQEGKSNELQERFLQIWQQYRQDRL